ncbi:hypothetical protein [Streptomyces violarus]|uniref:hypothetical protein n=1 Tax=Streptomyces violarus TaxID=67380 RepID=UPI0021BE62F1|nr:hypothetical protein [Streptomyces violarus]MCT9140521.1 hypothetical protein [Streptomyces violarus]
MGSVSSAPVPRVRASAARTRRSTMAERRQGNVSYFGLPRDRTVIMGSQIEV